MLHRIEDLGNERSRVAVRPGIESAPPVLAYFALTVDGEPGPYAARLRQVLDAVLEIAATESFEDELPVDTIPAWFRGICRGGSQEAAEEPFAVAGRERYAERTGGATPWDLQNWLDRFDPDLEVRGWAWWDLTASPDSAGELRLWADTWGEPFFAWEDLRWLLYAAGARTVADPVLVKPEAWAREDAA